MKERILKCIPIVIFCLLFFGTSIFSIITPDKIYSSSENRMLAQFKSPTKKSVLNGKFQKNYEKYISDQFIFRDNWISIKTYSQRTLGNVEINNVYFGKDRYLFEKHEKSDFKWKDVENKVKLISKFVKKYNKKLGNEHVKVMFIPSKTQILKDKLPIFAQYFNEDEFFKLLEEKNLAENMIDVRNILNNHNKEYIYYKTDHHWTTLGAYYAYLNWGNDTNNDVFLDSDFDIEQVSDNFLGTTHSKVNIKTAKDKIFLYNKNDMNYNIIYNMGEKTTNTFYDMDMLDKKDKYSVFFGGNQGMLEISSDNKNGKTLLMVKDSYANCFIPFIANHFEKIIVIDLRYVNINVSRIIKMYNPTDILVLYNVIQFMEDNNINKFKN